MKIDKFSCSIRGILAASSLVLLMGLIGCDGDESSGFEARIEASVLDSNAPIEISFRAVSQAPLDSELTYAWSFGDGEEGTGAEPNHTFSAPGEYTVSVSITSSDGSTGRDSVTVSLGEPTDLSVENIQLSSSRAAPGESLEVTWLLKNAAAQARAPVGTAVFLSVDELFDDNDRLLSRVTVAGNEVTSDGIGQSATVTIPDDAGTGVAFIIVVTDDRGLVGDIDRSNNTGLSSMPFRIRGETDSAPDLVVCGLSITGIDELSLEIQPVVEQTDQLEMEVCIANLGDRPTPSASYAIYLSEDETLDDNDLQIALKPGEALGVGERFNMVETIDFSTIDLGDNWHILVQVDPNDEASEQREDNNVAAYRRSFQVVEGGMVEGVDLLVPSVNVSQARVFWGQILSGSLTIQNRGSQSVERIFLVRLSLRPADGGAPVPLTSLNLDGLPSGESREEAFEVTLSQRVPQGEYTLVAEVDPTNSVGDVNEANNTRFFTMMLTLGGEPNIDLLPLAVELDRDTVAAGGMVEVRVRLANEGIDASGPFDVDLILSRDNAGS
ncbi:MAG: CARDB domain-containing protein, partial [Bradymonadia bacterium]